MEIFFKAFWTSILEAHNTLPTVLAFGGMALAWFLGIWMKKPLIEQSARNQEFKTQIDGFKIMNDLLFKRNKFLEEQIVIKEEYEALLVRRLRECEERHMRLIGGPGDGSFTC